MRCHGIGYIPGLRRTSEYPAMLIAGGGQRAWMT